MCVQIKPTANSRRRHSWFLRTSEGKSDESSGDTGRGQTPGSGATVPMVPILLVEL